MQCNLRMPRAIVNLQKCSCELIPKKKNITALTVGNPGSSFYLSSYENLGSDNAATSADAIHQAMLSALGLPTDLSPEASRYPSRKVAIFTSDTKNVMPVTNKDLNKFALFKGCLWVPCFHVGNLAHLDRLKIPSIPCCCLTPKQVVTVYCAGNFREVFLLCASALLDGCDCSTVLLQSSSRC
jgi:hypothetical protein